MLQRNLIKRPKYGCLQGFIIVSFIAYLSEALTPYIHLSSCENVLVQGLVTQQNDVRSKYRLHCLLDDDYKFVLVNTSWRWISEGACPYYDKRIQQINQFPCKGEDCPANIDLKKYQSYKVPKYLSCLHPADRPVYEALVTYTSCLTLSSCENDLVQGLITQQSDIRSKYRLHCLLDDDYQFVLVNTSWRWISEETCPYYDKGINQINQFPCEAKQGCPTGIDLNIYQSFKVFKYRSCLSREEEESTQEPYEERRRHVESQESWPINFAVYNNYDIWLLVTCVTASSLKTTKLSR